MHKSKIVEILRKRIGNHLADEVYASTSEQDVYQFIVERTPINKYVLMDILSDELHMMWIDLESIVLKSREEILPMDLAKDKKVFPLSVIGNTLSLLMADPLDVLTKDQINIITGYEIIPVMVFPPDLDRLLFSPKKDDKDFDITDLDVGAELIDDSGETNIADKSIVDESEKAPIVKMVNLIIHEALNKRASDIHIEPTEKYLKVKYRIDGIMQDVLTIPKSKQPAVFTRLKIMSNMDITEWRVPQDGRFRTKTRSKIVDFRVSSLPTIFGEKFVLRVLDKSNLQIGLDKLGFLPGPLADFKQAIRSPYGLILVTGPTGSGKSTTLYSVLQELNTPDKHIITVEDPVEYQVEGLTQIQTHAEIGLTFASALRAILRQSPDIVLVGEIRDNETADIAVKASLTGHLVLSTLHTNDAPSAVTRLIDMGVEPFLVASSLVLSSAQRLCRKICANCKEEESIEADVFQKEGFQIPNDVISYKGKGCEKCGFTGYYGRIATLETMVMHDDLRLLVLKGATSDDLKEMAVKRFGMKTLRDNTFELFLKGVTTFDEVLRVTTEG